MPRALTTTILRRGARLRHAVLVLKARRARDWTSASAQVLGVLLSRAFEVSIAELVRVPRTGDCRNPRELLRRNVRGSSYQAHGEFSANWRPRPSTNRARPR